MRCNDALSRRTTAAFVVLVLHLLLARLFIATTAVRHAPLAGDSTRTLELLPLSRPPPAPPSDETTNTPLPPAPPSPEAPGALSAFVAADVPRARPEVAASDISPPIEDDAWFDSRVLSGACARAYPQTASDLRIEGRLTLLVKIETTGRPSELKVVEPSGSSDLDAAAGACVMALGVFAPTRELGRPLVSWRRLRWLSARPSQQN